MCFARKTHSGRFKENELWNCYSIKICLFNIILNKKIAEIVYSTNNYVCQEKHILVDFKIMNNETVTILLLLDYVYLILF